MTPEAIEAGARALYGERAGIDAWPCETDAVISWYTKWSEAVLRAALDTYPKAEVWTDSRGKHRIAGLHRGYPDDGLYRLVSDDTY